MRGLVRRAIGGRLAPAFLGVTLQSLAACSAPPASPARDPVTLPAVTGPVLHFAYEALDGKPLSSEVLRGRVTLLAFLTTYDFSSQAQARFLSAILHAHTPRINVAALILEAKENRPLVEAFTSALALRYPVAMADEATIAGDGPFAGLHHVPSIVILDREGHEVYRHLGLVEASVLEQAIQAAESDRR